jgi:LPXTG-motif cell wall-anchored protein
MTCQPLPDTGLGANLGLFALAGIACVLVGVMVLLAHRSHRTRVAVTVLVLLMVGGAVVVTPRTPVQAAADCVSSDNSLTITQTSVMEGLAPGRSPVPITGLIVNNGPDGTRVAAIDVEITSVTNAPNAVAGGCDASDYRVLDRRMVLDRYLGPGGSAPFSGASIGFNAKVSNQDACKRATIHLRYTTHP